MKKELQDYLRDLEHQIDHHEKELAGCSSTIECASRSASVYELRMVRFRLLKILEKNLQQKGKE